MYEAKDFSLCMWLFPIRKTICSRYASEMTYGIPLCVDCHAKKKVNPFIKHLINIGKMQKIKGVRMTSERSERYAYSSDDEMDKSKMIDYGQCPC
jgi:hypothetical protein